MIGKTETSEPVGSTAINDVNRIKQLIESAQLDNSQDVRDSITELLNNIESYLILAEKRMDKLEVDQKLSEQLNNEIQELSKMLFATRIEDVERIRAIGNKLINMVA